MKKKIIVFLIILVGICALSAVSAVDDNSTDTVSDAETPIVDDANDVLSAAPENALAEKENGEILQEKINKAAAGSTITLEKDVFLLEGSQLTINKTLTINGNGHWIEGSDTRIVTINANNVILNNVKFTEGRSLKGGVILGLNPSYKLTINDCYFYANTAIDLNNPFTDEARYGSAIYWEGTLIIKDTTFWGNNNCGAIVCGAADVDNCDFKDNGARNAAYENLGGAITCRLASTIKNSFFYENKADYGGAIYGFEDIKISNCFFRNNQASKNGSAIYLCKGNINNIVGCDFNNSNIESSVFILHTITPTDSTDKDSTPAKTATPAAKNKLTLKAVKVKKSAKKLVITATLKKGKNPIKGKKVTFKFNGKKYKIKTNNKGVAKLSIGKKVLKKLKVGKKVKYQVSYGKLIVKKSAKVKK